ncbi:MAG: CRISPR-associated endonuclease Cas2 [Thermoproteota archaeon]|nr:MAG: CRISPR-associated endonuclease Cas2 [Candidatus Korarchaeota archaeon]
MRHCYVVFYDICDSKRLRHVFKTMNGFGDHMQYSVFLCRLNKQRLHEMRKTLSEIIDPDEDQIIMINIGPEHLLPKLDITHLGVQPAIEIRSAVII